MSPAMLQHLLFAQISRWERLGDGIHRGRGRMDMADFVPLAIGIAVVGALIFVVAKMRQRNDMSQKCDDPEKLFRELSLAHELSRSDQKMLRRLCEALELEQPAEVFLRPAAFASQLPDELHDEAEEFAELRERLF